MHNTTTRIRDIVVGLSNKYLHNTLEKLNDVETILLSEIFSMRSEGAINLRSEGATSGVVSKSILELIVEATNTGHLLDPSLRISKCIVDNHVYECIYRRKVNLANVRANTDEQQIYNLLFHDTRNPLDRFQDVLALFGV